MRPFTDFDAMRHITIITLASSFVLLGGVAHAQELDYGGSVAGPGDFGGSVTGYDYGGSVASYDYGGSVTADAYGGSIVSPYDYGGSVAAPAYDEYGGTIGSYEYGGTIAAPDYQYDVYGGSIVPYEYGGSVTAPDYAVSPGFVDTYGGFAPPQSFMSEYDRSGSYGYAVSAPSSYTVPSSYTSSGSGTWDDQMFGYAPSWSAYEEPFEFSPYAPDTGFLYDDHGAWDYGNATYDSAGEVVSSGWSQSGWLTEPGMWSSSPRYAAPSGNRTYATAMPYAAMAPATIATPYTSAVSYTSAGTYATALPAPVAYAAPVSAPIPATSAAAVPRAEAMPAASAPLAQPAAYQAYQPYAPPMPANTYAPASPRISLSQVPYTGAGDSAGTVLTWAVIAAFALSCGHLAAYAIARTRHGANMRRVRI